MGNLLTKVFTLHVLLGFILTFLSGFGFLQGVASLGINYGQVADNLPPPLEVLSLLRSLKLTKTRIYDTNPEILRAFANTEMELIVTVENEILATLKDPGQALNWVSSRIQPYVPATRITEIAVGNELYTGGGDITRISTLLPAMMSIQTALLQLKLNQFIKVSTPSSLAVLNESYPPSAGCFMPELASIMPQFLNFLEATNGTFWINAYPYFPYKDNSDEIQLDYVLFNPNSGMVDPNTQLHYDNMLYAMVDAVIFAMAKMGFPAIDVKVSETGWPSNGDPNEIGATPENAASYNRNLMLRQMQNEGTPLRPNMRLEVYVFALFNEDQKPGPTSERNFGLFRPDGTMAYDFGQPAPSSTSSPTSTTSISLTSNATQVKQSGNSSFVCSILLFLLAFQVFLRRLC